MVADIANLGSRPVTVAALLAALQSLPPDLEVWIESDDYVEGGLSGHTWPATGVIRRDGYPVRQADRPFGQVVEVGHVPNRIVLTGEDSDGC